MPSININNHEMYYEIHGEGDPAVCMGGWGTFCHGNDGLLARGLTDKYQVLVFDYRGIRDSSDDLSIDPSMKMHADDLSGLLDHLGQGGPVNQRDHLHAFSSKGQCLNHHWSHGFPCSQKPKLDTYQSTLLPRVHRFHDKKYPILPCKPQGRLRHESHSTFHDYLY